MTDLDEETTRHGGDVADTADAEGSGLEGDRSIARDPGAPAISPETASLLGLIDRLASLLERSDLVELEVEAGETGIVLRKPAALAPAAAAQATVVQAAGAPGAPAASEQAAAPAVKAVVAPLTGLFYGAPSPGSPPFVIAGQHIVAGQVVGLIEAMKLFNEIKSDISGRVLRVVAESGKLVKAKSPLIEVEPL